MIQILVTDRNLVPVGDPIRTWADLEIVGRFNEPGSGTFKVPAQPEVVDQFRGAGHRVVVIRDGEEFLSGPIEQPGPYTWKADAGDEGGDGAWSVTFAEDEALIVGRATYPNPAATFANQTTVESWTRTATNAAVVMRDLVDANAGPGALVARRVPGLVVPAPPAVGVPITFASRFEPLGDALRRAAIAGGGLGYRTRQVGATIQFQVYAPADLSANVRFSRGLGNLRAVTYEPAAPTVTTVLVGGQGEGTARTLVEYNDAAAEAAWWRIERFVDQRQAADPAELATAGAEALAEGGETVKLSTVTVDTPTQAYGVHYGLGDRVSVELYPGVQVAEVVRGFHLQADPEEGELLTAVIGSQDASRDPGWLKVGHDLARRLGRLERS